MDNRNILIDALQERLNYITFIEEECNPDEIAGIVNLLNILDPVDIEIDAEASYERFKEKYKDQLPKYFKKKRKVRPKLLCMICASAVVLLIVFVQLDSSASYLKGFFQVFDEGKNGISFLVTGNVNETYKSFEDLPANARDDLLIPSYIPSDLTLDKITYADDTITAYYVNPTLDAPFYIKIYPGELKTDENAEIIADRDVYFTKEGEILTAKFCQDNYIYQMSGKLDLAEFKKVVSGLN